MGLLKKLTFLWMLLLTVMKIGSLSYVLSTELTRMPIAVYASTGLVALVGLLFACKRIVGWLSRKALLFYVVLEFLSVLFNLIVMKVSGTIEVGFVDLMLIGTLANLVVDALLLLQVRRPRLTPEAPVHAAK